MSTKKAKSSTKAIKKLYVAFEDYAVEKVDEILHVVQLHQSFMYLDGWSNEDMLVKGFIVESATFKRKSKTSEARTIENTSYYHHYHEPTERFKIHPYRASDGHSLKDLYDIIIEKINNCSLKNGFSFSIPIEIASLYLKHKATGDVYFWRLEKVPTIHKKTLESKLVLISVNNKLIGQLRRENNKFRLKTILHNAGKISQDKFCEIAPDGEVSLNATCIGLTK